MEIKLLSGALGAEIKDLDLKDTSDENFKIINDLLLEHKVIFFRDQILTTEEHKALAEKFGPLETHAYVKGLEKYPEIIDRDHSCGMGNTYDNLAKILGDQVKCFLSYKEWFETTTINNLK